MFKFSTIQKAQTATALEAYRQALSEANDYYSAIERMGDQPEYHQRIANALNRAALRAGEMGDNTKAEQHRTEARYHQSQAVTLSKQYADQVEDSEQARLRANAQARGEVAPDPAKDLPKMTNQALEGAQGVKEIVRDFYPQRTDNQVKARLANVDGVAVPNLPIFKSDTDIIAEFAKAQEEQEPGEWKTVHGRRVFIREGETPREAFQRDLAEDGKRFGAARPPAQPKAAAQSGERGAQMKAGKNFTVTSPKARLLIDQASGMLKERGIAQVKQYTGSDNNQRFVLKDQEGNVRELTSKDMTKLLSTESDNLSGFGAEVASEKPVAAQFVSPNVKEHLTMDESIQNLSSDRQQWLMQLHKDVDAHTGMTAESNPAVGQWPDPKVGQDTENSSMETVKNVADYETLCYNSALKGLYAEQKSVLPFMVDETGTQRLYKMSVPTSGDDWKADLEPIQKVLDKAGIEFRTFVKGDGRTDVMVYDMDNSLQSSIEDAAHLMGADLSHMTGTGEFLGADDREAAKGVYQKVIDEYEGKTGKKFTLKQQAPLQKSLHPKTGLTILRACGVLYANQVQHKNGERGDKP